MSKNQTDPMPHRIYAWENTDGNCWWASEDVEDLDDFGRWYVAEDEVLQQEPDYSWIYADIDSIIWHRISNLQSLIEGTTNPTIAAAYAIAAQELTHIAEIISMEVRGGE